MSGKQMKRLRKAALGLATTVTEAGKQIPQRQLLAQEHRRALPLRAQDLSGAGDTVAMADGTTVTRQRPTDYVAAITAINDPSSLRGITRRLKKGMKTGVISKI